MVVSNTSPLVYLAELGDFALLPELFSKVAIPHAVYEEISVGGAGLPVACRRGSVSFVALGERDREQA